VIPPELEHAAIANLGSGGDPTYRCEWCNEIFLAHVLLSPAEVDKYSGLGYRIRICHRSPLPEPMIVRRDRDEKGEEIWAWHCFMYDPPEDPCDDDFMASVSS